MNDFTQPSEKNHSLSLVFREKLDVDGVIDVLDFDSSCVNIKTNMGVLSVEGTDLRIISLSKETGKIYVEGTVDSLYYIGTSEDRRTGLFRKRVK